MTKEEVMKALRNHGGEVRTSLAYVDCSILTLVLGLRSEHVGEIDGLKSLLDVVETKASEMKGILDEWPV